MRRYSSDFSSPPSRRARFCRSASAADHHVAGRARQSKRLGPSRKPHGPVRPMGQSHAIDRRARHGHAAHHRHCDRRPCRPLRRSRRSAGHFINGSGIDPYTGLDQFDRVADNRWFNTATNTDLDRIQHGYDRAGNRLCSSRRTGWPTTRAAVPTLIQFSKHSRNAMASRPGFTRPPICVSARSTVRI